MDKPKKKIKCLWTLFSQEKYVSGTWQTNCKREWDEEFTGDFKFCPFCGERIVWVKPKA